MDNLIEKIDFSAKLRETAGIKEGQCVYWFGEKGSSFLDACMLTNLFKSKREAKEIILQGGVRMNDEIVKDPFREMSTDDLLHNKHICIRRGKKSLFFLTFNS